jgi:replication factor C subunit 1
MAHLILKMFEYDIIEFNASDIRTQKLVGTSLEKTLGRKNVMNLMCNKQTDMAIIMDEIDGMTTGERSGLSELMKIMFPKKNVVAANKGKFHYLKQTPFICISNTMDKKLAEIKAKSVFIKFTSPSKFNLQKYCKYILEHENIIDYDDEIVNLIIDKSQMDYRRLGILLEYVFTSKIELTIANVIDLLENYAKKDIEHTYYECVEKMLNKYTDLKTIMSLYETNKAIIPMILYENFGEYIIKNRKNTDNEKLDNILAIYKNYSDSDNLDYSIYINQHWELSGINCSYKCAGTSYLIENMKKKAYNSYSNLNFSTLLNKTSQEYSNLKHANALKIKLFKMSNTNIICHFTDLFFYYLKKENVDKLMGIIKYYKMNGDDLDKLMKYLAPHKQQIYTLKKRAELKKILF